MKRSPVPTISPRSLVSSERLTSYLKPFSNSIRTSGSAEEARAFDYAEDILERLGFRIRRLEHEAFISVPGQARLSCQGESLECITHAMAAASSGLSAELANSDEEDQLSGKVALAYGLASPGAVRKLVARGAVGAVFVNAEQRYEMIISPVWGSPDLAGLASLPPIPVVSVAQDQERKLLRAVAEGAAVTIEAQVDTGWRQLPLLEATLEAEPGDGSVVLFSGHIDAWHLGAMDNGAANAAMLEVATVMAQRRQELVRDLRLLFWSGHSHGRYAGSQWYADVHYEELRERAILHVNIDSVGGKGASVLTEGPCMPETQPLAAQVIASETGQRYRGVRFERAGDQSFWGHGVSSLLMGLSEQPGSDGVASKAFNRLFGASRAGGFGWWWHTPEDTIDKVDPENLARDARIYLQIIYAACSQLVPPLRYSRTAKDLRLRLEEWDAALDDRLDLSRAIGRAHQLERGLERLERLWDDESDNAGPLAWRTVKAVARHLVPLGYVAGPKHEHDPALAQPPVPLLSGIEELAASSDEDVVRHMRVGLRRRLNHLAEQLQEALEEVNGALARKGER